MKVSRTNGCNSIANNSLWKIMVRSNGTRLLPCGTPVVTRKGSKNSFLFLLDTKDKHLWWIQKLLSLDNITPWWSVSNAFAQFVIITVNYVCLFITFMPHIVIVHKFDTMAGLARNHVVKVIAKMENRIPKCASVTAQRVSLLSLFSYFYIVLSINCLICIIIIIIISLFNHFQLWFNLSYIVLLDFCPGVSNNCFSGPCYSRLVPSQVWTSSYLISPSRHVSCPLAF